MQLTDPQKKTLIMGLGVLALCFAVLLLAAAQRV